MAMTLLTTNPDSTDVATVTFDSSIDSTYRLYIFKFIDINPADDNVQLTFQVNSTNDDGGDYDVSPITSAAFEVYHSEDDENKAGPDSDVYNTTHDRANSQTFQPLSWGIGNGADESTAGTLWLFNPSSTTFVKHFYSRFQCYDRRNQAYDHHVSGYIDDTYAIDDIQFKMSAGNMDGVIKMYGVG